jgi:hypothetical protein
MLERCSQRGRTTTTTSGRTVVSAICHLRFTPNSALPGCNGTERLSYLRAPRPVPLHHRAAKAQMTPGLYSSLDEKWGSGQQVYVTKDTYARTVGTAVSPRGVKWLRRTAILPIRSTIDARSGAVRWSGRGVRSWLSLLIVKYIAAEHHCHPPADGRSWKQIGSFDAQRLAGFTNARNADKCGSHIYLFGDDFRISLITWCDALSIPATLAPGHCRSAIE